MKKLVLTGIAELISLAFLNALSAAPTTPDHAFALDVRYGLEADGTLLLFSDPKSGLLNSFYTHHFGRIAPTNSEQALQILSTAMTLQGSHVTAEDLAKGDRALYDLNQFERQDLISQRTLLYESELRRAKQLSSVELVALCNGDGFYDTVKGGFRSGINTGKLTLFAEGKLWNISLVSMPESEARRLVGQKKEGHSFVFVALIRGNLVSPTSAVQNHLLHGRQDLILDTRHVEVYLFEFEFEPRHGGWGEDLRVKPTTILEETKLENNVFNFGSSIK